MGIYLMLIILGGFIALFSKQIDAAAARYNRNAGKRAGIVAAILVAGGVLGLVLTYLL